MRIMTGLDDKLIPIIDEEKPENIEQMKTFRYCFKLVAGQGQSKTADESRRALRVLQKLRTANGKLELSDEEYKTLLDRTALNQPQFITSVHGQLLEKLDTLKNDSSS